MIEQRSDRPHRVDLLKWAARSGLDSRTRSSHDPEPQRPDPGDGAADGIGRPDRRILASVLHRLDRQPGSGGPGDQRRHGRGSASDPRREASRPADRPGGDRPADCRRAGRAVDGRRRSPGPRLPGSRRGRAPGVPDPGLPERAARRSGAGRLPRGDRRRRVADDPVPAPAGARGPELRARDASGDGLGRRRRGDQ